MSNQGGGDLQTYDQIRRENARLRRAVEELALLNDLAREIGGARSVEAILRSVVQRSLKAVGAEQGVVTLVDPDTPDPATLVRTTVSSMTQPTLRPHDILLGWMLHHQTPLLLNEPRTDARFPSVPWHASVRSLLGVPMHVKNRLIGLLTLYNKKQGGGFTPEDQRLLTILAAQSAQVIENARLHEERERVLRVFGQHTAPAVVDELLRHGSEVASRRTQVCVMFLDIRGYTAFSEQRAPEAVVAYLNTLFAFMIDLVNLAARIEKLNKEYGTQLLISEPVHRALAPGAYPAEPIGTVPVAGRSAPITLYRLV